LILPQSRREADAAGFVLAGGRSSRMGTDKALIDFGGQPLIVHALGILRESGLTASIAGSRSRLGAYAPVIEDAGLGPLSGVCAGLASTATPYVIFLSVDLPLLPASLVMLMLHRARITGAAVTVPSVNGYAQTFPAIVDRSALPALETSLREGPGGCFSAFQAAATQMGRPFTVLPVELLVQAGQIVHEDGLPASLWFLNVNRPRDLVRAESIWAAHHRVS
jgi:molybdenum cofactor guanylyltransferase